MNRQECEAHARGFGLVRVTRAVFFAAVGPLDVHPYSDRNRWDDEAGYPATWKHREGRIVGYSYCGEGMPGAGGARYYWIRPKLLESK